MNGGPAGAVRALAALALLFNAFTWGVSWWPFRQLQAIGLHPLWLTGLIFAIAVAVLLPLRPAALVQVLRTPALWALVGASGLTNACFNWGVSIGDVVRVVLLFYLMPLWTVLLSRWLLGERISAPGALRVALALAGAVVVLWPAGDSAAAVVLPAGRTPAWLPDALGLAGGLAFALNNVLLRREASREPAERALAMFLGGALVSLGLAALLTQTGRAVAPPPLALAGAVVVLWPTGDSAAAVVLPAGGTPAWLPDVLGLAGGFAFALNNVLLRREASREPAERALAMFLGGALVSLGLAAILTQVGRAEAPPPLAPGWGAAALGMAVWFLASNLTLQYGAARLPANTTSVIMISEVFFASASAMALGAGTMGPREALGALMIVGGALLASVQRE